MPVPNRITERRRKFKIGTQVAEVPSDNIIVATLDILRSNTMVVWPKKRRLYIVNF